MSDDRIDLKGTGWRLSEERERALSARIVNAAGRELERRTRGAVSAFTTGRWMRPVLAGAAILAAVSLGTLLRVDRDGRGTATTADVLEVPFAAVEWMSRDSAPGFGELIAVVNENNEE